MRTKYANIVAGLVVLAIVCSLVAIASAPVAGAVFTAPKCPASGGNPQVTWSAQSAYPGQAITGNGSGFTPGAAITVTLNGIALTAATTVIAGTGADPYNWPSGTWMGSFTISDMPAGNYTSALGNGLVATDTALSSCAAWFQIVPKVKASPTYGSVGTTVTLTGRGFTYPGTATAALFLSDGVTHAGTLITSPLPITITSNGTFTATFTMPQPYRVDPNGNYTITVTDSAGRSSSTNILLTPSVQLIPASALPGQSFTVQGSNFPAGTAYIYWQAYVDGGQLTTVGIVNGSFATTVQVPAAATVGQYYVWAVTGAGAPTTLNSAKAVMTVLGPTLTISPASGPPSMGVKVQGQYFPTSTDVAVSFAGNLIDLVCVATGTPILSGSYIVGVTTTSTGAFDVTFQVPATEPYGVKTVAVFRIIAVGHPPTVGTAALATSNFTVYDAPRFPVDNPINCEYWHHEYGSLGHVPSVGPKVETPRAADDTYALDLNWKSGDSDLGKSVYAIQRGVIEQVDRAWGWVLIKHNTSLEWKGQTYNVWYSGYLHMQNIPTTIQEGTAVERSDKIGEVAGKNAKGKDYSPHLHFAIYIGRVVSTSEPLFDKFRQNAFLESVDPGQVAGPAYAGYEYGDAVYSQNIDESVGHNDNGWFEKGGSVSDWGETTTYGFYSHMFYTHTEKTIPDNWGRWSHILLADGQFTVFAFIPRNFGTTGKATYVVSCNGNIMFSKTVSQASIYDQWVELGPVNGKTGDRIDVYLSDKAGEKGKYVAYDAIKIWMKQDVALPRY